MEDLYSLKKCACEAIDSVSGELHEVSREIWKTPELGYEEHHAHEVLTKFLEKQGFPVERHYKGIDTAFMATEGQGSPHVAVLCEYDALPGIGHACGHNLIAEVGAAAGLGIKAAIQAAKNNIGKVTILGCPAEEAGSEGGGKVKLINRQAFSDIQVALMCHPFPVTLAMPYNCSAMLMCKVVFQGKASHAAGFPWEGVNALDAAVMAYSNISCLRQQMKPTWRVHGVITNGGAKPNIIPEETSMEYYVRAPTMGEARKLKAKMTACFQAAATATACNAIIQWNDMPYENLICNQTLVELFSENAKSIGVEFCEDKKWLSLVPGSTDMGNVSHVVPSIHPMFYIGQDAVCHTREFTAVAGADKAQKYTLDQAKALAMTALDVMCKPHLLDIINKQFQEDLKADAEA